MSLPVDCAEAASSASLASEMSTGKSVTPPEPTFVPSIRINLRFGHVAFVQPLPMGSHVSQLCTACPVATGIQRGVPVAASSEKIQLELEPVLIEPSEPTMPGFIIAP